LRQAKPHCIFCLPQNEGKDMTAYSSVRFKVKPGQEERFEELFRVAQREFEGLRRMALGKSPDGIYFSIGEWDSYQDMVTARPRMLENLNTFRDTLQDFGSGSGVTDPIAGEAIFEMMR
jgi:hypothetical protein